MELTSDAINQAESMWWENMIANIYEKKKLKYVPNNTDFI